MPSNCGCIERYGFDSIEEQARDIAVHEQSASAGAGEFTLTAVKPSYAPHVVIEPVHMDITIGFDIPNKSMKLEVKTTFKNPHTVNSTLPKNRLSTIQVNGVSFENLVVSTATEGASLSHTYDGKIIHLTWDKPFNPLEERVVVFKYDVVNPIGGAYFSTPDPHSFAPKPSYAVTDHETERCRYWLACVDYPTVRTSLDFQLIHDPAHVAIANGALVSSKANADGTQTTRYRLEHKCPSYLICFAVGEFIQVDDGEVDGMPIKYFAPKGTDPGDLKRAFDQTPSMVRWLSKKLNVKFPWPKYYQFAAPHIRGAMENISLVSWSEVFLMDETFVKERKLVTDCVNIHEMAHTYFGDLVVIRHFEHVFLKESWATYIESVWLQDHFTDDDFRFEMLENADSYIAETNRYVRPIVTRCWDSSWQMFDSHTYPGGCWRLHQLRSIMGDNCFWTAVSKYLATYSQQTVEADDFRKCLERESGLNLNKFFDQWIYGKGFPKLKAAYEYNKEKKYVQVSVEQTQMDKARGIGTFDFSLEVEVTNSNGKTFSGVVEFKDGNTKAFAIIPVVDSAAAASSSSTAGAQSASGANDVKPTILRFDPNMKVLFSMDCNPGEDILSATAKDAKDVVNRVWAYRELVKLATPSAMRKVKEAIASEKFYGVRVKVADALAKVKTKPAAEILAAMLKAEKEPKAMWGVAKSCRLREPVLRDALVEFLARNDISYRGRAAALECLALQHNPVDSPYFLATAKDNSQIGQHGFVRAGALRALGHERSLASFQYLLSRVTPGLEPDRVRPTVYEAIALSALWQESRYLRQAVEVLVDGLRDENMMVRRMCVWGLVDLEARDTLGAIADMKRGLAEQDWPFVERRMNVLRDVGAAGATMGPGLGHEKVKELTKTVEEMETKMRKLEEKVTELTVKSKAEETMKKEGSSA